MKKIYTLGKISIEHVTIFLSRYISKGAADMTFSPDVGNNPSNPYIQNKTKQINKKIKLCVIKWNETGKSIEHMKKVGAERYGKPICN